MSKRRADIRITGGINTYLYALGNPINNTDLLGLFTGKPHNEITAAAIAIAGNPCGNLARDVAMADWLPGSQDPKNSHWHAMRDATDPNETVESAKNKTRDFVNQNLKSCSCAGLARALHAIQDNSARGHSGHQPWGGGVPSYEHVKGDRFPTEAERSAAVDASVQLIKQFQRDCKTCPSR